MLTIGSTGVNVTKAQNLLNQKTKIPSGTASLIADGRYGQLTANMVKLFQSQNGLTQTGNIDNPTAVKLGMYPSDLVSTPISVPGNTTLPSVVSSPIMASGTNWFEQNKRNIMIVVGGLSLVFIIALAMRNRDNN